MAPCNQTEQVRPPTLSIAQRTRTLREGWARMSRSAAARPESPAPTTRTEQDMQQFKQRKQDLGREANRSQLQRSSCKSIKIVEMVKQVKKSIGHRIHRYVRAFNVSLPRGQHLPHIDHLVLGGNQIKRTQAARTKWYPADDCKKHPERKGFKPRPTKLRKNIQPGQVLILLAGRFRGRRVVFLKQLPSGLLLVTGPYKVNGVPLKRVNQTMVQPTTAVVDISKVNAGGIDDKFFNKIEGKKKLNKSPAGFFQEKIELTPQQLQEDNKKKANKKVVQKQVDASLIEVVKKEQFMKKYLSSRFTLSNNDKPHTMRF